MERHLSSALSAPLFPLGNAERGRREREKKKEGKKDEKRREEEKTRKDRTGIAWPVPHKKSFPLQISLKRETLPKTAATYSPTLAVPSARSGLTSLFGMGRGGTPTL